MTGGCRKLTLPLHAASGTSADTNIKHSTRGTSHNWDYVKQRIRLGKVSNTKTNAEKMSKVNL